MVNECCTKGRIAETQAVLVAINTGRFECLYKWCVRRCCKLWHVSKVTSVIVICEWGIGNGEWGMGAVDLLDMKQGIREKKVTAAQSVTNHSPDKKSSPCINRIVAK